MKPPEFPAQLARRFHPQGLLGQGNMGAVFRAVELTTQRAVAIKLIAGGPGSGGGEVRKARFEREGALTAELAHPNIVRLLESGVAGHPYLVYELVDGARTFAEVAHLMDPRATVELLRDAARAVGFAHSRGIVHRDLKGANLLIDRGGKVRIADFGIAFASDLERLTQTGVLVGTPSIMAPEQMKPKPEPVPPTDVWALGVLLYQHLTGKPPFDVRSLPQVIASVLGDDPLPPTEVRPGVDAGLAAISMRCLEKDPARRYANGDALADDLQRVLDGEEPEALFEETAPLPLGPLAAALAVAVLGVVVLGLGLLHALGGGDPAPALPAPTPTPRHRAAPWSGPELVLDHHAQASARGMRGSAGARFFPGGLLTYGAGLQLWRSDGQPVRTLGGPYVTRLIRIRGGLLAGGQGKGLGLWRLPSLTQDALASEFQRLDGTPIADGTAVLAAFPHGSTFLVADRDGPLRRVELSSLRVKRSFEAPRPVVASVAPDGKTLVAAARAAPTQPPRPEHQSRSFYWVFETATGAVIRSGSLPGQVRCLAHAPDGSYVVFGTSLGGLISRGARGEDTGQRPFVADPEAPTAPAHGRALVRDIAFDPSGTRLYSVGLSPAGQADELRVWFLPSRTLERTVSLRRPPANLAVSPGGERLAIGCDDGVVEVWATD